MRPRRRFSSSSIAALAAVALLVGAAYTVVPSLSPFLPNHSLDTIEAIQIAGCGDEAATKQHASAVQGTSAPF